MRKVLSLRLTDLLSPPLFFIFPSFLLARKFTLQLNYRCFSTNDNDVDLFLCPSKISN